MHKIVLSGGPGNGVRRKIGCKLLFLHIPLNDPSGFLSGGETHDPKEEPSERGHVYKRTRHESKSGDLIYEYSGVE